MSGTCLSCGNPTTECERCETAGVCPCCPCECAYPDPSPAAVRAMERYDREQEAEEEAFYAEYMARLGQEVTP